MFKLASLFVEIGGDTKPLDTSLATAKSKVAAAGAAMKASFTKAFSLEALGAGVGFAAASMATNLGSQFVGAAKDAVFRASDLNETVSKTEVVFGGASKSVIDFGEKMRASFGSNRKEILDSASGFGLIAKGAGMSKEEAAGLSVKLAGLADDASSFYNVGMDVALEKIRAGLTGESEPLRAFGVLLNEDAVKAEAMRMGLVATGKTLSESAKVMARASLIQKGLADAEGDHARTQGQFANQTRELTGRLTELGTAMGGMVLGPANALTGWANTQIKKFETLTSTVGAYHQKLVTALGGKAPDTTAADAAAAKKSEAAEKARKALEEESRPENVRARKAKALAAAELEKPAEEDALRKARGDAYKEKAEADRAALRGRVAESVPLGGRFGTKGLSSAIKGEKPEAVKAITEAFHAEAEATISGAERLKSILKEKLGTVTGLASSATGGALSLANAVAGRFGSGKDVTQSRDAAQAEIDQRAKDAKEERRRNFVPQTFSSAREMDRAVTAMVSGADKKEKVSEEQLREIKKNSDAQVTHLKVMADNLTSIAKSGLVGILK